MLRVRERETRSASCPTEKSREALKATAGAGCVLEAGGEAEPGPVRGRVSDFAGGG